MIDRRRSFHHFLLGRSIQEHGGLRRQFLGPRVMVPEWVEREAAVEAARLHMLVGAGVRDRALDLMADLWARGGGFDSLPGWLSHRPIAGFMWPMTDALVGMSPRAHIETQASWAALLPPEDAVLTPWETVAHTGEWLLWHRAIRAGIARGLSERQATADADTHFSMSGEDRGRARRSHPVAVVEDAWLAVLFVQEVMFTAVAVGYLWPTTVGRAIEATGSDPAEGFQVARDLLCAYEAADGPLIRFPQDDASYTSRQAKSWSDKLRSSQAPTTP